MTTTTTTTNNNNNMQDAITKEGPVAYEAGHYLVSNGLSPSYPVAPAAFGALDDSDSETTKDIYIAYDSHKKICSARSSNTSKMHGGAYLEDGVGYCTLCDQKL